VSKYSIERSRHVVQVERLDEQTRVPDLPPSAAAHEAAKLRFDGASLPRRLLLKGAEGCKVSLCVNDLFHGGGTKGADQLVLQVCDTDVETESFQIGAREVRTEAGPLETTLELTLLCEVTQTGEPGAEPLTAEQIQEPSYGLRTSDGHNSNTLGGEISTASLCERFERALVADSLNQHDRTRVARSARRVWCEDKWSLVHGSVSSQLIHCSNLRSS
jgi:hypothetical protein